MATAYATTAELETYLPASMDLPEDAERLLMRASERVDDYVLAAFSVDEDGIPTDALVAGALRDAACAQVEFWIEVGEAHDVDGIRGGMTVPGTSYEAPPTLAPRARSFLARGGLMNVGDVGT